MQEVQEINKEDKWVDIQDILTTKYVILETQEKNESLQGYLKTHKDDSMVYKYFQWYYKNKHKFKGSFDHKVLDSVNSVYVKRQGEVYFKVQTNNDVRTFYDYLHSGATATFEDILTALALLSITEYIGVTVQLQIYYVQPVTVGTTLYMRAWVKDLQPFLAQIGFEAWDEGGQLIAQGSQVNAISPKISSFRVILNDFVQQSTTMNESQQTIEKQDCSVTEPSSILDHKSSRLGLHKYPPLQYQPLYYNQQQQQQQQSVKQQQQQQLIQQQLYNYYQSQEEGEGLQLGQIGAFYDCVPLKSKL